jgi:hypothetical protein
MRGYQLPKGGAGIEALVMVEGPGPKPAYRQVLVKVAACSLRESQHGRECWSRASGSNRRVAIRPPFRRTKMGSFVAGVVRRQCQCRGVGLVPCRPASQIGPPSDGVQRIRRPDRRFD